VPDWSLVHPDLKQLLAEVDLVADRMGAYVDPTVKRPTHYRDILALFDRCRSTFGATRTLLRDDFTHEAVPLDRPLFTDSLMLAELATADERRRVEIIVGWWLRGLADGEGFFRESQARGEDESEALALIAKRRSEAEEYASKHDAGTSHWKADEKRLAATHGREDEYIDFRVAHHFVHGSAAAVANRLTMTQEDFAAIGGPSAQLEEWGNSAGVFAASSLLHACRSLCDIFGWSEPPNLDALFQRLEELAAPERSSGSGSRRR
jgi:hypothetical protein